MRSLILLLLWPLGLVHAQVAINGPMPGYSDMLETTIWMQCQGPCTAHLEYWALDRPDSILTTLEIRSDAGKAHAMDHIVSPVVPGTMYGYRPIVNGLPVEVGQPLTFRTQTLWRHRTDAPDFTIALGSCAYINEAPYDRPGRSYGGEYGIFDAIANTAPDLMLWTGDNIYLREPDWGSRSGFLHRYTHARSTPELQRLLRSTHHYAIWDDHDFGPNDSEGSFVNSALSREMFDLFWPNPTCGAPGVEGITTMFTYADIDFYLLDDRTYRVPPNNRTSTPAMLGTAQLDWLIRALRASNAPFKLVAVGSQVLNSAEAFENYANFSKERGELLRRIEEEGITGVVFLTGDRHFTELSQLTLKDGRTLYDLTVSPLTSGVYTPKEVNTLRVPGTLVDQRNFGRISFTGPKNARVMTLRIHNAQGTLLWERAIPQPSKN